jgi:hypothetical protein
MSFCERQNVNAERRGGVTGGPPGKQTALTIPNHTLKRVVEVWDFQGGELTGSTKYFSKVVTWSTNDGTLVLTMALETVAPCLAK